jgi:hypothetical protein
VAGGKSSVPFDSAPSRACCVLAHNNTGRAWAIIGHDPDATQTDDLQETNNALASLPAFGTSFSLPSGEGLLTEGRGAGFRRFPRGSARHLFLGSVGFNRRASGEGAIRKFGINPMHQNRT